MKSLIFFDVHNRSVFVEEVIKEEKNVDRVILAGDYFDSWGDNPQLNELTAHWVKTCGYETMMGNHDLHYAYPLNDTICSGFTEEKCKAINSVMTKDDWEKLKFVRWVDGWLITHAGLHPSHIHPKIKDNEQLAQWLVQEEEKAKICLKANRPHWFFGVGRSRGGYWNVGGLVWCDFNLDFEPVPGVNQMFGHTIVAAPTPVEYNGEGGKSKSWAMDTNSNHYAVITDGQVEIKVRNEHMANLHMNMMLANNTGGWPGF